MLTFKEILKNELKELLKQIVNDKDYVVIYTLNGRPGEILYERMTRKQIIRFSKKSPCEFLTCIVIEGDVLKG